MNVLLNHNSRAETQVAPTPQMSKNAGGARWRLAHKRSSTSLSEAQVSSGDSLFRAGHQPRPSRTQNHLHLYMTI